MFGWVPLKNFVRGNAGPRLAIVLNMPAVRLSSWYLKDIREENPDVAQKLKMCSYKT